MPYCGPGLAQCWLVLFPPLRQYVFSFREDFLQQRLEEENKEKTFSELPFYYVEIAKVLLDVSVHFMSNGVARLKSGSARRMTSETGTLI